VSAHVIRTTAKAEPTAQEADIAEEENTVSNTMPKPPRRVIIVREE